MWYVWLTWHRRQIIYGHSKLMNIGKLHSLLQIASMHVHEQPELIILVKECIHYVPLITDLKAKRVP